MSRARRWGLMILTVVVIAVGSHLALVLGAPRLIMRVAEGRIADQAGATNQWLHTPRTTPENQQVVRSSPDLAYSACAWDLSDGPVRITAPAWDDYFSLTLYDARTDNFLVANDRTDPEGVDVLVVPEGWSGSAAEGTEVVVAPSSRGVALLRYLAPTEQAFRAADAGRVEASCG